jgi:hypothetical protein
MHGDDDNARTTKISFKKLKKETSMFGKHWNRWKDIIKIYIIKKEAVRDWTGFRWLWIGSSGGLL